MARAVLADLERHALIVECCHVWCSYLALRMGVASREGTLNRRFTVRRLAACVTLIVGTGGERLRDEFIFFVGANARRVKEDPTRVRYRLMK
jgi:hypothetical protein